MIPLPSGVRVWLATGHTDMRKGFASLSLQVQQILHRDPLSGHLFCFRGRRGNLLKVIWHDGQGLFQGVPTPFTACRYHSLVVAAATLPPVLRPTAHSADGLVMAMTHRDHPTLGVQFHPESFRTEHGMTLLRNFVALLPVVAP